MWIVPPEKHKFIGSSLLLAISAVLWSFFFLTTSSNNLIATEHRGLPISYWEKSFPAEKTDRGKSTAVQISAASFWRGVSAPIYNSASSNPIQVKNVIQTFPATKISIYDRSSTTAIRLDIVVLDAVIWLLIAKIVQVTSNDILKRRQPAG